MGRYNMPGLPGANGIVMSMPGYEVPSGGSGVFYNTTDDILPYARGTKMPGTTSTLFDLSRANPIHGRSNTVMPASVDMTMGLYLGRTA